MIAGVSKSQPRRHNARNLIFLVACFVVFVPVFLQPALACCVTDARMWVGRTATEASNKLYTSITLCPGSTVYFYAECDVDEDPDDCRPIHWQFNFQDGYVTDVYTDTSDSGPCSGGTFSKTTSHAYYHASNYEPTVSVERLGTGCASIQDTCEVKAEDATVASVTSDKDAACVGCRITFTATTDPTAREDEVSWSGGGTPSTGTGPTFRTNWGEIGTKTVTASLCGSSVSKDVAVAAPTNFHQTYWEDLGDGVLYFEYAWDSSTGHLSHLSGCRVGEVVYYPSTSDPYIAPDPPFDLWAPPNPTRIDVDATLGEMQDEHGKGGEFSKPYCQSRFGAYQWYQYLTCFGGPINLEYHDIERSVYQVDPLDPSSVWQYKVEKSGHSSTMDLP
jgi:hypothetical protein